MRLLDALLVCVLVALALLQHAPAANAAGSRLRVVKKGKKGGSARAVQPRSTPPSKVAMFTVVSPCQHTQAAAYYFAKKVKAADQTEPNQLDILYTVDADDNEKNGIMPWRRAFKAHMSAALKAKDASQTCFDGIAAQAMSNNQLNAIDPQQLATGAGCTAPKLKAVANQAIIGCKDKMKARFNAMPDGVLHLTEDATWALNGANNECALACALAMTRSNRIKSCSATYSKVKGEATAEFGLSLSQDLNHEAPRPNTVDSNYASWYNEAPGHHHAAFDNSVIRSFRDKFQELSDSADVLPEPASEGARDKTAIFVANNRGGCSEDTALKALQDKIE